jgi:hypothetical protein
LKQEARINLCRVLAALIAGLFLGFVFLYLFFHIAPRVAETLGETIGEIFGLGFEGASIELLITVIGSVAVFSMLSWLALRTWGPWRHQVK